MNKKIKVKEGFKDAFYSLPANKIHSFKETICKEMGWANSTFYSKCNGNRKLKNPERILLQAIFEGFGIETEIS